MKTTRRILALVIAMVIAVAMATTAFAVNPTYSITIGNPTAGETYSAYKIFDATYLLTCTQTDASHTHDENCYAVSYTIKSSDAWFDTVTKFMAITGDNKEPTSGVTPNETTGVYTGNGLTLTPSADKSCYVVSGNSGADATEKILSAADFAAYLIAHKPDSFIADGTTTPVKSGNNWSTEANKGNTITVATPGYYLVDTTLGALCALGTTTPGVTIEEKNKAPTVTKTQNDVSADSNYAATAVNVQVGDTIYYKVSVTVPANATANSTITLTDTMSSGLTPADVSTITAKIGETELPASVDRTTNWTAAAATSPATYTITISVNAGTLGKTIDFYIQATVNDKAISADTTKGNKVELNYSHYTQQDSVNYETGATGALKYDGATGTVNTTTNELSAATGKTLKTLAGAQFELRLGNIKVSVVKHPDGYYYPKTTESETEATIETAPNGKILIRGLDKDTSKVYTLVETKAPDGYNLLTEPVSLTVTANNTAENGKPLVAEDSIPATSIAKIANNQGTVLPTTGGIGTTIFYVVGGLLAFGALVLLITKRRMNGKD